MIRRWIEYLVIKKSGLFDPAYYLRHYKDVRRIDVDPLMHYIKFGWKERRNPGPLFNTNNYLESNPEVRLRNINPLVHYIRNRNKGDHEKGEERSNASSDKKVDERQQDTQTPGMALNRLGNLPPLKKLRNKVLNGWDYLRVNGIKKFVLRLLSELGISPNRQIHPSKSTWAGGDLGSYAGWYKESLEISQGSDKRDYVSFIQNSPSPKPPAVKLIAFYLPQYHPIPENDAWWGKGFTEWTNVSKAVPQFVGHYQPHLPGELGFYDLRVQDVQRRQIELAKNYGIYGFCFYYYWFAGKKLLSLPLERFIQDSEIDFPFCICWANENWTRRWDGYENDVLIRQDHTVATELKFIQEIIPLLKHPNYICIDRHPIIIVYRVDILPDPRRTAKLWKEKCLSAGIEEPYLIAAQTFGFTDPRTVGFDAAVEFPPHNIHAKNITDQVVLLNPDYSGCVYPYSGKSSLIELYSGMKHSGYKAFKTVAPGWDNEPRKPGRGDTFGYSTPEDYKTWLKNACEFARNKPNPEERIVFINAWNEWGEGAYLEPDRKFGYAYLQATYAALEQISTPDYPSDATWTILFVLHDAHWGGAQVLIKNIIGWLREHTAIKIKLLFLDQGDLLPSFSILGETLVLDDGLQLSTGQFTQRVIEFCGGKPDLIYGNTVAVGKVYESL